MTPSSEPAVPGVFTVPTPVGEARVWLHEPARDERALVVLGHGAGRGVDTRDLQALASGLPGRGIAVALLDQPWVVAGRRAAAPPAQLDTAFLAAVPVVHDRAGRRVPLVVGGRSAGARVACRTAVSLDAVGVVALAFPLHPPGRPDRSRIDELVGAGVSTLVLQGERDTFGGPAELARALTAKRRTSHAGIEVEAVAAADHSFNVLARAPVTEEEIMQRLLDVVGSWVLRLVD